MSDTIIRLHTVAEAAEILLVTEDWLIKKLRARELPGRKVGRNWRMATTDIEGAVEQMAMPAISAIDPAGLTRTSRRRHNRRRAVA